MHWQVLHLFYILSSIKATTNTQGHGLKGALHYEIYPWKRDFMVLHGEPKRWT